MLKYFMQRKDTRISTVCAKKNPTSFLRGLCAFAGTYQDGRFAVHTSFPKLQEYALHHLSLRV